MLRLRIRRYLLAAVHVRAPSSLHRFLLFSTSSPSPARLVAEDFLVTRCGLAPALALRASRHIAHLKCSSNPEAVIAFFADSGLTKPGVAAAIARDPLLLCSSVEKTLKPRLAQLRDVGLSPPQISSLITIAPRVLRSPYMVRRLTFYLSSWGSYDKVHSALKRTYFLLARGLDSVVKPNMVFLRQCGLTDSDIARYTNLIVLNPERLKEIVAQADKFGVPRCEAMFKRALVSISKISLERIDAKLDFLKKVLGCSDNELGIAVRKLTHILTASDGRLKRKVEFLKMEVGLKAEYIVHRPALFTYGIERRLMPRHHVLKVLKEKGLMKKDIDFFTVVSQVEEKFVKRFIEPYKDSVPGLADGYASAAYAEQQKQVALDS